MTRRSDKKSSVGIKASNHNVAIMPVAEVDHGSDIASATARPSASRPKCFGSKIATLNGQPVILEPPHVRPYQRGDCLTCCSKKENRSADSKLPRQILLSENFHGVPQPDEAPPGTNCLNGLPT